MTVLATLVAAMLAWGALSYGAVSRWAYWPLLATCAALGIIGLLRRRDRRPLEPSLAWGVLGMLAVVLLQLVPLSRPMLGRVSPATDAFLQQDNLNYAAMVSAGTAPPPHALSIDPDATWRGAAFVAAIGLLFLGLSRGLTRRDTEAIVVGVVLLGAALALEAMVQRALWPGTIYGVREASGAFGPFANRNHFAGWMLMAVPLGIGYFSARVSRSMRGVKPNWRQRVLWLSSPEANNVILLATVILVMGVALALTVSRSAILAFGVALGTAAWFARQRQVGARRHVTFASVLLLGFLSVAWVGVDRIVGRFAEASETAAGGRLTIWGDTLRIIRDFPLAGTGMNTYHVAMLRYESAEPFSYAEEAHNDYLQLVAEGGLVMTTAAAAMLVVLARHVKQRLREDSEDLMAYYIRAGAVTGLIGIGLQELVDFSLQLPGNAVLFAVLWALAVRQEDPVRGGRRVAVRGEQRAASVDHLVPA